MYRYGTDVCALGSGTDIRISGYRTKEYHRSDIWLTKQLQVSELHMQEY